MRGERFIDTSAFRVECSEGIALEARAMWNRALGEARAIVTSADAVMRLLPYRVVVQVYGRSGCCRSFRTYWRRGSESVLWYDIQHDPTLPDHLLDLLRYYNLRLEALVCLQAILRETVRSAERLHRVRKGEVYNDLAKGPGAARLRGAAGEYHA